MRATARGRKLLSGKSAASENFDKLGSVVDVQELHIHRWAVKHHLSFGTALVAHSVAAFSSDAFDLVVQLREGKLGGMIASRPAPDEWLRLYRHHRRFFTQFADMFGSPLGKGDVILQRLASSRDFSRRLKECTEAHKRGASKSAESNSRLGALLKAFQRVVRRWLGMPPPMPEGHIPVDATVWELVNAMLLPCEALGEPYRAHLAGIMAYLNGTRSPGEEEVLKTHEMQFFLQVVLPCYVLHKSSPEWVMRRARQGQVDDIENLVRLDSTVLYDRRIEGWVNGGEVHERQARQKMIADWIGKGPSGRLTGIGVRQSAGAYINLLSRKCGFQVIGGKHVQKELSAR